MLKTYFLTALRNLRKRISFTILNISGLAIGIACAGLIFLWVRNEVTFDDYFVNKAHLYKIKDFQTYDGETFTFDSSPGPLAEAIKEEVPGIANTARSTWRMTLPFSLGDKSINESGLYVDPSFLKMFHLKFIAGTPADAFKELKSLVISKKMADKFFGDAGNDYHQLIGKQIKFGNNNNYFVTGIISDLPENVSVRFEWLSPFKNFENDNDWLKSWGNNGVVTFVETMPNANVKAINRQLYNFLADKGDNLIAKFSIYPMSRWHLYDNWKNGKEEEGAMKFVRLFSIIAWIILVIACINFMNLSTARSEQRSREVGVRKVLGSGKKELILQFMSESFFMAFLSAFIAVGIIVLLLPSFNQLVDKQLSLEWNSMYTWGALFSIIVACGLLAGSYPAFYLSSFNPVHVLKGLKTGTGGSAAVIRKGLVVLQFSISIILIIATIVIYKQVMHVKNRDLGYNKANLITIPLHGNMKQDFAAIRNELLATNEIENVALNQDPVLQYGSNTGDFTWEGKDPTKQILITMSSINAEYIPTVGYKIDKGRNFYADPSTDSNSIIINNTLARLLKTKQPIGAVIGDGDHGSYTVVGVVDDFIFNQVYSKPAPLIFFKNIAQTNFMTVRIKKNADVQKAVSDMTGVIRKVSPGFPVDYSFVDSDFDNLFKTETLVGKLAGLFAILAIFISCLGLFGLAAYTAEQRTREIGIRKVLGAGVARLIALLTIDFLKLVGIACLIAFPLAWWIMHNWLQGYDYRITISWTIFAMAFLLAIIIANLTVSFQAIKAALMNPVRSLKVE